MIYHEDKKWGVEILAILIRDLDGRFGCAVSAKP